MTPGFENYRSGISLENANALAMLLEQANIAYYIEQNMRANNLISTYGDDYDSQTIPDDANLQIRRIDFKKANQVLNQHSYETTEVGGEDFLKTFTDKELMDVIYADDEWGEENCAIAKNILEARGIELTEDDISELHEKRMDDMHKPRRLEPKMIVIGVVGVILGGLMAIVVGGSILTSKKMDSAGNEFYEYDNTSRFIAIVMILLSFVTIACMVKFIPE
jgi:hypothetical protein